MLWTVAAASLIAGLMIGLTGIGGVLVVPALTEFAGVPVDRAIAASMFGVLFAGVPAAFVHLRRAQLPARPLAALCIASALGAVRIDRDSRADARLRGSMVRVCDPGLKFAKLPGMNQYWSFQ